jgi:hypothetical protein
LALVEHILASCIYFWVKCYFLSPFCCPHKINTLWWGRALAKVVSRRPVTADARFHARVNPCGICSGRSGTGTGFSPNSSVFPCQYIISPSLSKLMSSGECVICIHAWVLDPPHLQEIKKHFGGSSILIGCVVKWDLGTHPHREEVVCMEDASDCMRVHNNSNETNTIYSV